MLCYSNGTDNKVVYGTNAFCDAQLTILLVLLMPQLIFVSLDKQLQGEKYYYRVATSNSPTFRWLFQVFSTKALIFIKPPHVYRQAYVYSWVNIRLCLFCDYRKFATVVAHHRQTTLTTFTDFSLTSVKFTNFSSFSRRVITLLLTYTQQTWADPDRGNQWPVEMHRTCPLQCSAEAEYFGAQAERVPKFGRTSAEYFFTTTNDE